ncbi:MAG: pathosis-related protein [Caulobacteraceae bacterium]|nr:pathosis-related protein [Caulobacteraceae bacterium]
MKTSVAILYSFAIGAPALCAPAVAQEGRPDLAGEMVRDHNALRAGVGLPPVIWDEALARHAQVWADRLVSGPGLEHSPHTSRPGEGENLARIDGAHASATAMFSGWAREGERYRYGPLNCADLSGLGRTGHYTQVIWKGTRRIGCAVAYAAASEVLVCRYGPPGNLCGGTPY